LWGKWQEDKVPELTKKWTAEDRKKEELRLSPVIKLIREMVDDTLPAMDRVMSDQRQLKFLSSGYTVRVHLEGEPDGDA
jgi:hypothetical protein